MGNFSVHCCTNEREKNIEIVNEKEEEDRVERSRALAVEKFRPKEHLVIRIQKLFRARKFLHHFNVLVEEDKQQIKEYFESNGLFLDKTVSISSLLNPVVKQTQHNLANRKGTFASRHIPQDVYREISFFSKYSVRLDPVWLNEDKKTVYMGYWNKNLKPNGYGVLIKADGSKYEGFFHDGKLNGFGRYFTVKGEFFEGYFIHGVASGKGIFVHPDGNIYLGDWHNDKTDGNGEEFFADGSYFKGSFRKGKKNGLGFYRWKDGSSYEGEFKEDFINGTGYYKWPDGSSYNGRWRNNLMNGQGFFVFPDGSTYEGEFVNNKRSGKGKYYWNESKFHIGEWKDGKQHGKGVYHKDGKVIEGIWNEGKLVSHKEITNDKK